MFIEKRESGAWSSFRLETDGVISRLTVDGVDMSHALEVQYVHNGHGIPTLTVVLPVEKAEISGTACVQNEDGPAGESGEAKRSIGCVRCGK